ncbi:MAG TPA: NAD(P)/FAD-dependent oxidoreductase [Jatrophihabitans sp.]|nr:NAD(P)/FAD-dependent oxidoreductase [Jatrophihabitans sp.]
MAEHHVDVLIVGAGVSGIGAACHLERECPGKSYAILERRRAIGGTWDLFRYPGIRSDSDMFTFGYNFQPWHDTKVLADGESIRTYLRDTAREYGVERHIRFGAGVQKASWSSTDQRWTVTATDEGTGETTTWTANFLLGCTGYYNYDRGHRPDFPGEERFAGTLVHPQHWPDDLDHRGKRIVIIGSGATAVTLMPALAQDAAHVTMLQRSPTYIVSLPARDEITAAMRKVLPPAVAYKLARARNITMQRAIYALARARPDLVRRLVVRGARRQLGDHADLKHFTPEYDPWDQRLCVVPDGDLFRAIRAGKAEVVTDRIKTLTESGVELESGRHLDADIIITATGLAVQMLGGAELEVDGRPVRINERVTYKGVLLEGVPNAALVFGYINASWTLKADLAAEYTCRLLNYMDEHGYSTAVARALDADRAAGSVMGALKSGYVVRGNAHLPRQGTRGPWKVTNNYLRDVPMLRRAPIDDGVLEFGTHRASGAVSAHTPATA